VDSGFRLVPDAVVGNNGAMRQRRRSVGFTASNAGLLCLPLIVLLIGCRSPEQTIGQDRPDWAAVALRYRETNDYRSLVALLPLLEIRKSRRSEIEKLLGPATYNPTPFQSYYPTDRSVPIHLESDGQAPDGRAAQDMHFQIILVVQYLENHAQPTPQDLLDSFSLGPVGE